MLLYHVSMYLTGKGPLFMVYTIFCNFLNQIVIGFVRAFRPSKTTYFTFTYLLTHVVFTCLFYFGKVGEWHDRAAYTQQIAVNFVLVNAVQFNDIFFTLFAQIPLFMIGIFVQSLGECDYAAKNPSQAPFDCQALITLNLNRFGQIALGIGIAHWYQQYEISILAIEKELANAQQAQLKDFLMKKNEGIAIIAECENYKGELLTQNAPNKMENRPMTHN